MSKEEPNSYSPDSKIKPQNLFFDFKHGSKRSQTPTAPDSQTTASDSLNAHTTSAIPDTTSKEPLPTENYKIKEELIKSEIDAIRNELKRFHESLNEDLGLLKENSSEWFKTRGDFLKENTSKSFETHGLNGMLARVEKHQIKLNELEKNLPTYLLDELFKKEFPTYDQKKFYLLDELFKKEFPTYEGGLEFKRFLLKLMVNEALNQAGEITLYRAIDLSDPKNFERYCNNFINGSAYSLEYHFASSHYYILGRVSFSIIEDMAKDYIGDAKASMILKLKLKKGDPFILDNNTSLIHYEVAISYSDFKQENIIQIELYKDGSKALTLSIPPENWKEAADKLKEVYYKEQQ